jgi:hypothetical protein
MSFGMTLVFVYMGEGGSGDSIVIISENQYSGESPLLPSPCPPLNPLSSRILPHTKINYLTEILSVEE